MQLSVSQRWVSVVMSKRLGCFVIMKFSEKGWYVTFNG